MSLYFLAIPALAWRLPQRTTPASDWQRAHDALHATLAHTHSRGLRQRVWARQAGLQDDAADDPAPPG